LTPWNITDDKTPLDVNEVLTSADMAD